MHPTVRLLKWGLIGSALYPLLLVSSANSQNPSRYSKSIGHQHVLEPELRTTKGAHDFAQHLLTKAAERLRRGDYYCRRLGVHLSWVADLGGWWDETDFHETRDTGFLLARLEEIWKRVPRTKPLSVGVVLLDLVPAAHHQPDLFAADNDRRQKLSPLIDRIKRPLWPLRNRLRPVSARCAGVQGACGVSPSAGEVGVLTACSPPLCPPLGYGSESLFPRTA